MKISVNFLKLGLLVLAMILTTGARNMMTPILAQRRVPGKKYQNHQTED